jgi:hypothetical protein
MTIERLRWLSAVLLVCVTSDILLRRGSFESRPLSSCERLYVGYTPLSSDGRALTMASPDDDPRTSRDDIRIQPSRFKVLQYDSALLRLERTLQHINKWNDPAVRQQFRLARFGTEAGKARAIAQLVSVVEDYEARAVAYEDPFMPYGADYQISNGGRGIHILNQANNGIPLYIDEDALLLDVLILGRQGGGKSSAVYHIVNQTSRPLLIIDPKDTWRYAAASIRAETIDVTAIDLTPPAGVEWEDWLFKVMEAAAQAAGVQFGLDLLVEASQIALRQRQQYISATGNDTSLCLKDIKAALPLCSSLIGKRADYRTSAETALSLLIGSEKCMLFATRRGLPLDRLLRGRYIMPCPYLSAIQSRFLGLYLFLYMRHSARGCETTHLRHLTAIDDAGNFVGKPTGIFSSGPAFGP